MILRTLSTIACTFALATASFASAQMEGMNPSGDSKKPMPSPPATATVSLAGQTLTIKYNAPSKRNRPIFGALVPYDKVWRTGANPATTFITPVSLHIGTLLVPAGTYTLYTLPSSGKWMLIVNKQNGQWGTEYDQSQDLGRTEMKAASLASPQERMSISFARTEGSSTELHIKWDKLDESVKVSTP